MHMLFNYSSPLEQFEVSIVKPLYFFSDISITNATVFMFLSVFFSFFLLKLSTWKSHFLPNWMQVIGEMLYRFVLEIVLQQAGKKGVVYFPIMFATFLFILLSNLLGLVPFGFTTTSHIIVTFLLSLSFNLGFIIIGFLYHNIYFLKIFVPEGAPKPLLPLIIVIEIISYMIRSFSLAIRLFANMLAGHTLLHIIGSFVLMSLSAASLFVNFFSFFFLVVIILFVLVLESAIAGLQAYVFVTLLCVYLNDSLYGGH